jgi:hypothetical protein
MKVGTVFSVVGLGFVVWAVAVGGIVYVGMHFISKFW